MRRSRQPDSSLGATAAPLSRGATAPSVALLAGAGLLAFAGQLRTAWPFSADDAFITFRYAANWAAGEGPNFNPGGERSEGVTSFGFLLLSTLVTWLGADALLFAKLFGVACAIATAALLALLALDLDRALDGADALRPDPAEPRSGRAQLAAAFACFSWLGFYATSVHAASGMETLLAAALLTALVRVAWLARTRVELPGLAFGVLALALGLVRPELNVAAAAALSAALAGAQPLQRRALLRSALLGWWIPGALYFAARASYYGQLFPIPFYAKISGGAAAPGVANALALAKLIFGSVGFLVALPLLAAPRRFAAPAAVALCVVLLALLPDPVMDFDFRYALPAFPILFALAGLGFARVVELIAQALPSLQLGSPQRLATALTAIAALSLAARAYDPALTSLRERHAYGLALESTNLRLGKVLADYRRSAGRTPLLALGDVGAIPYTSGWRTIDTFSLNDPAIAIGGRDDPAYVLDQNPDLVIAVSTHAREFRAHWANRHDGPLFEACRARGMRPAVILTFSAASYLFVMTQPGSEIEGHLRRVYLEHAPPP